MTGLWAPWPIAKWDVTATPPKPVRYSTLTRAMGTRLPSRLRAIRRLPSCLISRIHCGPPGGFEAWVAQAMAAHESPTTTKPYNDTGERLTLDEIERINAASP
jgi:hypothetical protein